MQLNLGGIQEDSYRSENVYSHKEYRWGWAHLNDGEAVLGIMGGNIKDTDTIDVTIYDSYLFVHYFFVCVKVILIYLLKLKKQPLFLLNPTRNKYIDYKKTKNFAGN